MDETESGVGEFEIDADFLWDIQRKLYLEGEEELENATPMADPDYEFEFQRFYLEHNGDLKTYSFVATLNEEVAKEEEAAGFPVVRKKSAPRNVKFKWEQTGDIWHIDISQNEYELLKDKIYFLLDNGEVNPKCVKFGEDYYGKDVMYYVFDANIKANGAEENFKKLSQDNIGKINTFITDIREIVKKLVEKGKTEDLKKAEFNPEDYGITEGSEKDGAAEQSTKSSQE